jgi:hypothetical protein
VSKEHLFLVLAVGQLLHSLEEYFFLLWESFPPARFLSGLVSSDLETGFIVINVSVVAAAFSCYAGPIRNNWRAASGVAWFWVVLETVNGLAHPAWAIASGGYTPGLITSLLLLPFAVALGMRLSTSPGPTS